MAESRVRDTNRVRDMYEGVDPGEMTTRQKKAHRGRTLQMNPDVLFKIYQEEKLHVLLFSPTDDEEWMRVIQNRFPASFELTRRRAVHGRLPVINMSGPEEELERICARFDQLYKEVQENILDGEAAQKNLAAEIEELKLRIGKLEIEINVLLRRLVCALNTTCPTQEELERICDWFDQFYNEVQENILDGHAALRNITAEIEEVSLRIGKLEIEINVLQRRLAEVQIRGQ
ncbi:hypothetical protein AMELA_G00267810 [Ameiurus melas]|uniref:Uncharacterized protein n=1 Tax=Ameiurus melas TaxID=219545 RepID=A0A7J5ZN21_AMEME|nr:hypothetical protein AMELA_G00267810 [Ameiurus melas]